MTMKKSILLVGLLAVASSGCVSYHYTRTSPNGVKESVSAVSLFSGTAGKIKSTVRDGTYSRSIGADGSTDISTNLPPLVEAIVRGAVAGAIKGAL